MAKISRTLSTEIDPAGHFTIFFPEDGHIPGIAVNDQPVIVRKVVIKVAV